MIDVFVGALVAGASLGWTACDLTRRYRHHKTTSGAGVATTPAPVPEHAITLPPFPDAPVVMSDDGRPIQAETLDAVAVLLHRMAHVWMFEAYGVVVDQVAADEAAAGVDGVEDAANQRRAS